MNLAYVPIYQLIFLFFVTQTHAQNDVLDKLNLLWKFVKPISFALIGKEVLFSKLDVQLIGYGVLIVIVGSLVSCFISLVSIYFICATYTHLMDRYI